MSKTFSKQERFFNTLVIHIVIYIFFLLLSYTFTFKSSKKYKIYYNIRSIALSIIFAYYIIS